MSAILTFLIQTYQRFISPLFPNAHCRFYPTCSCYAIEAISTHGSLKGLFFATKRLLRCHPLHSGGYDPVP